MRELAHVAGHDLQGLRLWHEYTSFQVRYSPRISSYYSFDNSFFVAIPLKKEIIVPVHMHDSRGPLNMVGVALQPTSRVLCGVSGCKTQRNLSSGLNKGVTLLIIVRSLLSIQFMRHTLTFIFAA